MDKVKQLRDHFSLLPVHVDIRLKTFLFAALRKRMDV